MRKPKQAVSTSTMITELMLTPGQIVKLAERTKQFVKEQGMRAMNFPLGDTAYGVFIAEIEEIALYNRDSPDHQRLLLNATQEFITALCMAEMDFVKNLKKTETKAL